MASWLRHWKDWAIPSLFRHGAPSRPTAQGLLVSYEKAGILVRHEPVPWNADQLRVEANLRVAPGVPRRKVDFLLFSDDVPMGHPEMLLIEEPALLRLGFSLPPPPASGVLTLHWRHQEIGQAVVQFLSEGDFHDHLDLRQPTIAVRLADQFAPCSAFLPSQSRQFLLSGILASPTSLAPLAGQDLEIEIFDQDGQQKHRLAQRLSGRQLQSRETLWQVPFATEPKGVGPWIMRWRIGERLLARQELVALPRRRLPQLIECKGCWFVRQSAAGKPELLQHLGTVAPAEWLAIVFLVTTREPGLALRAEIQVEIENSAGGREPLPLFYETTTLTDGPTPIVTPLIQRKELRPGDLLLLRCGRKILARLPTQAVPQVQFTGEGGFHPSTEEFPWSPAAEAELAQRLGNLTILLDP